MIKWILTKIVGTKNQREVRRLRPIVEQIVSIEESWNGKGQEFLLEKTREWQGYLHRFLPMDLPPVRIVEAAPREELEEIAAKLNARFESLKEEFASLPTVEATPASIEEGKAAWNNITPQFDKLRERYLNQILPEAFAAVKHGARLLCGEERDICGQKQVWDMVHFDVQLLGGIALHRGYIAEMATGEGKTLVATLPVYLNALTGMGVHVVTVNDYLARRDSEWMGMLFQFGALFTDLSVFDNVAFPMREQTDLDEETIRDLVLMKLNAVGLRGAAHLMPSEISGGMARRVALARAIALDPALIMYDEPFAGLDPISLGVTANLIRKLNDALHSTSVIVTHDVVETFEIADYVYMINAGRVAAEGSPEELCRSEEPFVKQFINALPDGPVRFHYPANSIEACFGGEER